MSSRPVMLYLTEAESFRPDGPPPGFLQSFAPEYEIRSIGIPYHGLIRLILRLFPLLLFSRRPAIFFTTSYSLTFAILLFQALTFSRARHISVSLNLSRRPLKFDNRAVNALINRLFARLDLVLVHSMHEVGLFHDLHAIPREKFVFVHWGYDLPVFDSTRFDDHSKPYFCMIGRNNRDRASFLSAMRDLPAHGVLVAPAYAPVDPATVPDNVEVLYDIPNDDCLNCIANSRANIILVNDENSGAGHITAVYAMHLGIPQVVSNAMPLREYFIDGFNAVMVPIGDAAAVRTALTALLDDDTRSARIADNGTEAARNWLHTAVTEQRMARIVRDFLEGRPVDIVDPAWTRWRDSLTTA